MRIACACGFSQQVDREGVAVAASLLAAHCTTSHPEADPHALTVEDLPADGSTDVRISCLAPQCHGLALTRRTHREYVAALAIVFHSAHEGHRLRIEVDGVLLAETPHFS